MIRREWLAFAPARGKGSLRQGGGAVRRGEGSGWAVGPSRQKELGAPHTPVLLAEVLEWLEIRPDGIYVDATLGAGGHSSVIAGRLTTGRLIGLDRDGQALEIARQRLREFRSRVTLVHAEFSRIGELQGQMKMPLFDGVLADLGVSTLELDSPERGFSFRWAAPLDMRMNPNLPLTADEIVNHWPEKDLADLLYQKAEERDSRRIARAIVRARPIRDLAATS